MALEDNLEQNNTAPIRNNHFYRDNYHRVLIFLTLLIVVAGCIASIVIYQIINRPLPQFNAKSPDGGTMLLVPYDEPNMLPDTILRWASKAATVAYTFDFVNYNAQIRAARPYFTDAGWADYLGSVDNLINTIVQRKLFIYGVVSGAPVISNQGPLPGRGNVWRIQIPFLVSYASDSQTTTSNFYVVMSIVQVPTSVNPQGIGIDQFLMFPRG